MLSSVISGFCHGTSEICVLLRYYTV